MAGQSDTSKARERCYLCGSTNALTRDHIPPKNLFPKPRPSNLVVVPCCFACNNGAADDDEYFRIAVSCMLGRSEVGDRIWNDKVIGSTFKRRRIMRRLRQVLADQRPALLRTPFGNIPTSAMQFRCDQVDRVLIRITRAFLFLTHPEVDSSKLTFEVTMIRQFGFGNVSAFLQASKFPHFELGNGIFQMWRGLDRADVRRGVWFYLFYNSAGFGVVHQGVDDGGEDFPAQQ